MDTEHTLSFCITCYSGDINLLDSLIDWMPNQTSAPDEILISCSGLPEAFQYKFDHIYIQNKKVPIITINSPKVHNQACARNAGAFSSSCEYIMFFDIDDIPHPQKIEVTKKYINGYDFLVHSFFEIPKKSLRENFKNINFRNYKISSINYCDNLDLNRSCSNISVMCKKYTNPDGSGLHHAHATFKTSIFDNIQFNTKPQFHRFEDGIFLQQVIINKYSGIHLNASLIAYSSNLCSKCIYI